MRRWFDALTWPLSLVLLAIVAVGVVVLLPRTAEQRPLVVIYTSPTPSAGGIVYVSGAVAHPGLYPFQDGDRVEQALAAAGGPNGEADTAGINLATRLKDEQRVHVPRNGELLTSPSPAAAPSASGGAVLHQLNLNAATLEELDVLPGIGPVTARKIADYRAQHGPFKQVEELRSAKLVGAATYDKLKDLVTVGP